MTRTARTGVSLFGLAVLLFELDASSVDSASGTATSTIFASQAQRWAERRAGRRRTAALKQNYGGRTLATRAASIATACFSGADELTLYRPVLSVLAVCTDVVSNRLFPTVNSPKTRNRHKKGRDRVTLGAAPARTASSASHVLH